MLELKTILICLLVEEQLQLWRELLSSQGYQLMLPEPETNLVKLLDQAPIDNLPDLVVIDLGLKIPDTSALQSSTVARWCRENQPQIKVVFTNPKEDEVLSLEYRWALRQGAISLLPKLNAQNLLSSVKQISVALGTRIGEEALQNFVNFLQPNNDEAGDNLDSNPSQTLKTTKHSIPSATQSSSHQPNQSFIDRCEYELTEIIGPMAHIILRQTLANHPSQPELVDILAAKIPNPAFATKFRERLL